MNNSQRRLLALLARKRVVYETSVQRIFKGRDFLIFGKDEEEGGTLAFGAEWEGEEEAMDSGGMEGDRR